MKQCQNKKLKVLFWEFMTSMSDRSRVLNETLSDKLYSTRRETDFINCRNKISLVPHAARAAPNYQFIAAKGPRQVLSCSNYRIYVLHSMNVFFGCLSIFTIRLKSLLLKWMNRKGDGRAENWYRQRSIKTPQKTFNF